MATEIERKFLVRGVQWRALVRSSSRLAQGYILDGDGVTVRVRASATKAWLTVKGPTTGITRAEFEYEIPLADAQQMLATLCERAPVEKTRHLVDVDGLCWEIDEFEGANAGLIVAEVELAHTDVELNTPSWAGPEVSGIVRYYNSALSVRPFSQWTALERAELGEQ